MKIDRVVLTGADMSTNPEDLFSLGEKYPFVEFGILFSKSQEGVGKYPTLPWIMKLSEENEKKNMSLKLSAHFCGWWSRQIFEEENFGLMTILSGFSRVQLNYNFERSSKYTIDALINHMRNFPDQNIILQYNKYNSKEIDNLLNGDFPENLNILYDSSGGTGKLINQISPPFKCYTGYSGGIGPDNIKEISENIINTDIDATVFIDMENKIRTNDVFDLNKCEIVLRNFL